MAKTRRSVAERFLQRFTLDRPSYEQAAKDAVVLLTEILENIPVLIHVVSARCKDTASLRLKLSQKGYGQPKRQVTDLLAARVIAYYRDEIPIVVRRLREALEVDELRSVDKKTELEAVEFGYTSVHLIARTKGSWSTSPKYFSLRGRWFEIQIRSVLEHAWAEIEHEVVYKSGIEYPSSVKRRFARIAGAIEMLEDEFVSLRDHKQQLIGEYKARFLAGDDGNSEIDTARMIAMLECERPHALGWRAAAEAGQPFPAHLDNRCVQAIRRGGIKKVKALRRVLKSRELRDAEEFFLRVHRLLEPPSHLVTARLIVLIRSPIMFADYFPDQISDPAINTLLRERRGRRKR